MQPEERIVHDPPEFYVYAVALIGGWVALVALGIAHGAWAGVGAFSVLFWCALAAAANLLPVPATKHLYLSMSAPMNIAIAVIFPPAVAATLVGLSSISRWEVAGQAKPSHAVFNRTQLGLSSAAAAALLHLRQPVEVWTALLALVVYHATNWVLVAGAERLARGTAMGDVLRKVLPSRVTAAVTYLALGGMGIALSFTYQRVGTWAVALLLLPLLGARQAIQASHDVERVERERRLLADRLIEEREQERLRIAGELHDWVLQDLASFQVQANTVRALVPNDERVQRQVIRLTGAADQAITDIREAIADLRRSPLDSDGLIPAVERFARLFARQSGIGVTTEYRGMTGTTIPASAALVLFECCQEALTNIGRHASAASASVELELVGNVIELRVRDDGRGYPWSDDVPEDGRGQGLALTQEKLASCGGGFWVRSAVPRGTEVVARLPIGAND
jgi:signal transduction histidine kinase